MSIYPVRLNEWFPFGDEYYETAKSIVDFTRCLACGKKCRYRKAVGHHSLPWGYGDLWCSEKCMQSGKVKRADRRRDRRLRRRFSKLNQVIILNDLP